MYIHSRENRKFSEHDTSKYHFIDATNYVIYYYYLYNMLIKISFKNVEFISLKI